MALDHFASLGVGDELEPDVYLSYIRSRYARPPGNGDDTTSRSSDWIRDFEISNRESKITESPSQQPRDGDRSATRRDHESVDQADDILMIDELTALQRPVHTTPLTVPLQSDNFYIDGERDDFDAVASEYSPSFHDLGGGLDASIGNDSQSNEVETLPLFESLIELNDIRHLEIDISKIVGMPYAVTPDGVAEIVCGQTIMTDADAFLMAYARQSNNVKGSVAVSGDILVIEEDELDCLSDDNS
jgi:hypothetical protein